MTGRDPRLSLVVVDSAPGPLSPRFFDPIRSHLAAGRLEVIVVSPTHPGPLPSGARWLPCAADSTVPQRRTLGLNAADAPLKGLTESFCVLDERWVWGALSTFRTGRVAAAGGRVTRTRGSTAAWALTLIEYGRSMGRDPVGPVSDLAPVSVCYDAAALAAVLDPDQEVVGADVHEALRARGGTLWRSPEMVVDDRSDRSLAWAAVAQWHHGRLFGARRARTETPSRQSLRVLSAPLVAPVLLSRIARGSVSGGHGRALVRALPALCVLLAAWVGGEVTGTVFGEGAAGERWR